MYTALRRKHIFLHSACQWVLNIFEIVSVFPSPCTEPEYFWLSEQHVATAKEYGISKEWTREVSRGAHREGAEKAQLLSVWAVAH